MPSFRSWDARCSSAGRPGAVEPLDHGNLRRLLVQVDAHYVRGGLLCSVGIRK